MRQPATTAENLNLLDGSLGATGAWLTETGFDYERTTTPGLEGATSTSIGFVTVDYGGVIHVSADGWTWTSPPSPPTWSVAPGEPGFVHGTVVESDSRLLAISAHGESGWMAPIDPTTEIWSSTIDVGRTNDR